MKDNLKDSMIVNLTRKKILELVQKIELINWFEINYAVQKKPSRLPRKIYSYGNISP